MNISKESDVLRIAVTFRRPSDGLGPTKYEGRLNARVASSFVPDAQTIGKALHKLKQHGFSVTAQGPMTASIRGSRGDFEKLFGTKLSLMSFVSDDVTRYSLDKEYYPEADAPWNPDPEVSALIDDAYIQLPHIYFNQRFSPEPPFPIPPQVSFYHLCVPGDVSLLLNTSKAHRQGFTGRGVRVVMIDTGFAHARHSYFQEMGYNTSTVLAPGATDRDQDGNGHGTGESANFLAAAPDVTFVGVKLENETDPRLGATVLEGFLEARRHNPDIISVSLGYDLSGLTTLPHGLIALEAEIAQAVADGIIVVFSAGNGHVAFPGMMPDVVSAGGVFVHEDGAMEASDYASSFESLIYPGRQVPDFCGLVGLAKNSANYILLPIPPGCEIDRRKDRTSRQDGWGVFSGTSAAAPQLAGVCALLKQKNPGLTPDDIKNVLRRTCRDVVNGMANPVSNDGVARRAGTGIDDATGAGLVDAFAALQQV